MAKHRNILLAVILLASPVLAGETIDVASFGATPNDGKDDTAALLAAFAKCRGTKDTTLVFADGQYDIKLPDRNHRGLIAEECAGLTIDGRGATLMFHSISSAIVARNVQGLTIRNLTIDMSRPPFSVGTVTAATENSFEVQVEKAFPLPTSQPVEAFMQYDPATRLPARRGLDAYYQVESTELIGPQVLRVKLKRAMPVKPGMLMVLRHQVYGFNALDIAQCRDVRVEDVTVHTIAGMGLVGSFLTDATIQRMKVVPRDGMIMSATADATHFNCCYGTVTMKDCVFEGMGDDATNVHGMFLTVSQRVDDHTVVASIRNNWIMSPRPGDRIELTDPATLLPYGVLAVAMVRVDAKAGTHRLTVATTLPERLRAGDVLGNTDWAPRLRISNCTVRNNRARGFLVQTRDAIIENNTFDGCTGAGIHVTADCDYWRESISTRDVVIRNNQFVNCGYGPAMAEGVINVFAHVAGGKMAPKPGVHRHVTIENNTIRQSDTAAIFVGSTDGFTVRGNPIEHCCDQPARPTPGAAIRIHNSANGKIEDNRIPPDRKGAGQKQDVVLDPGCDASTIEIK